MLEERLAETQARSDEEKKLVEDQLAEVSAALAAQKAEMAAQAEQHREDVASHRTNYWVHAVKENLSARSKLKKEEKAKELARTDLSSAQEAFASLQNDHQQLLEEKEEHASAARLARVNEVVSHAVSQVKINNSKALARKAKEAVDFVTVDNPSSNPKDDNKAARAAAQEELAKALAAEKQRHKDLKAEIKQWEKDFEHREGRKPSNEEKDTIRDKYEAYRATGEQITEVEKWIEQQKATSKDPVPPPKPNEQHDDASSTSEVESLKATIGVAAKHSVPCQLHER